MKRYLFQLNIVSAILRNVFCVTQLLHFECLTFTITINIESENAKCHTFSSICVHDNCCSGFFLCVFGGRELIYIL
jgi:hypothetical protein